MKRIVILATFLAFVVVLLGAYTRLKDAGLGCPDWPGCYGHWTVPTDHEHITTANDRYPKQPLESAKAWPEMIHRYFAGTLGLLVLGIAANAWRYRKQLPTVQRVIPLLLAITIVLQALLGKYTVTLGLHPVIVMAHLLGGFTTLTLLAMLSFTYVSQSKQHRGNTSLSRIGVLCTFVLIIQIALGGWTSANYAARSCPSLPTCVDDWLAIADFSAAFSMPPLAYDAGASSLSHEYAPHLDVASKITIQMTHRIGAIFTLVLLGLFFIRTIRSRASPRLACQLAQSGLTALLAQVTLGLLNIVLDLPLAIAVAHNGVAALLLLTTVTLTYQLTHPTEARHEPSQRSSASREHSSMA